MIASRPARSRLAMASGLIVASLLAPSAAPAQTTPPPAQTPPSPAAQPKDETPEGKLPLSAEETAKRQAWRETMSRKPMPQKGCFKSTYPNTEWQEVPCGTASPYPNQPVSGTVRPDIVGNFTDYAAQSSGTISSATGPV